ncbi:MAG: rRNA pseudouridine synthase [Treponema sp.]|nr:rRNA pseudouridine synthase [Treponema sp.]
MKDDNEKERLDKVLSNNGFGSRKSVRRLIRDGAVSVNGKIVNLPDAHVNITLDRICVDGEEQQIIRHIYLMMNKAAGYVCSTKCGEHKTVYELLDEKYMGKFLGGKIAAVGRLDVDTEGLLVFTTDGALNHFLTAPKNRIPKTYLVHLKNEVPEQGQELYTKKLAAGIHIEAEGSEAAADCLGAQCKWLSPCECELTIYEGKYHEVKRMFLALGNEVIFLKRLMMNGLELDSTLAPGQYRDLTDVEIEKLAGARETLINIGDINQRFPSKFRNSLCYETL